MAKTKIEWTWRYHGNEPVVTGYTFNPWIGCTKVSPGCANCYAERENNRRKWTAGWGKGCLRKRTSKANWDKVSRWNRKAMKENQRRSVFVASLADVYDHEILIAWRVELFKLMTACTWLDFLVLTKRPENILSYPQDYNIAPNIHLGVSIENKDYMWRSVVLGGIETRGYKFISLEPLLGPIDLDETLETGTIDWVIVGGESGPRARPMHPRWAATCQTSAEKHHIPFFFKQWGTWAPPYGISHCGSVASKKLAIWPDGTIKDEWNLFDDREGVVMYKVGKKKAGDILYARRYKESPFNLD